LDLLQQIPSMAAQQKATIEETECFEIKVFYTKGKTGFEQTKDFVIRRGDMIAGRYTIIKKLGGGAFSDAVQCLDTKMNRQVCVKIVKNNKDYIDQSLDEIKVLKHINETDPHDTKHLNRLYDFFYFKEHLCLVFELYGPNLYDIYCGTTSDYRPNFFRNLKNLRMATKHILTALDHLHSQKLIHMDLKPENIVMNMAGDSIRVIDMGSTCYTTDHLSSYAQSRAYRAPEIIMQKEYSTQVDMWSLGCVLYEIYTGKVLFSNYKIPVIINRMANIVGPFKSDFLSGVKSRLTYFNLSYSGNKHVYTPKNDFMNDFPTDFTEEFKDDSEANLPLLQLLRSEKPHAGKGKFYYKQFCDFLSQLLRINPDERLTAAQALKHSWLNEDE
jgi:dual specificity tyrosine-phosphorylation-regulated kinase 2/3/4